MNEDNWYDKIFEIAPVKKDEYYIQAGEETMKAVIDFTGHLADYKDSAMKEYNDLIEYDSGTLSVFGIYYDNEVTPQYVKLCSYGENAECIDNKDAVGFVNRMAFENDMREIFWGGFGGTEFPY